MKDAIRIFLCAISFFLCSCMTLYKPNTIHSPLLKEEGELKAGGALSVSGSGLLNLDACYALTNHFGILAGGMYHYRRTLNSEMPDSGTEKLNILSGEIGAGYFKILGREKHGLFQCYGGVGSGFTKDRIDIISHPEVSAKYSNFFLQPGIGYTSDNFDIAFDLRGNYVRMRHIYSHLYHSFQLRNNSFLYPYDTSVYFVNLEPTATMKAGGKNLKGVLQLGITVPTINVDTYFNMNTSSQLALPLFKLSLGVVYTFRRQE